MYAPYHPLKTTRRVRFSKVVRVIEIPRVLNPHVEVNGVPPFPRSSTRRVISAAEMRLRLRHTNKMLTL